MTEILRDKNGKVIGSIRESSGVMKLYTTGGKLLGSYNKGLNITYDAGGSIVAKCNLLVSLLKV